MVSRFMSRASTEDSLKLAVKDLSRIIMTLDPDGQIN